MSISWLTVVAQVFNFLLLVYLLQRFLYHPVIDAMQRREHRIAKSLEQAEQREHAASTSEQHYSQLSVSLEAQRKQLITQAQTQAAEQKQQLLDAARAEIDTLRQQWQHAVQLEKDHFLQEFNQFLNTAVSNIANHVLTELAERDLEQQMLHVFLQRCEQENEELHALLANSSGALQVRSSQSLHAGAREQLKRALTELWQFEGEVIFTTEPALICGIELLSRGRSIGWSVAEYTDVINQRVRTALETLSVQSQAEG